MKTAFILLIAVLSFGFSVENPAERARADKQRAKDERIWRKAVNRNYDLDALRKFLDESIRDHPIVEGVSLSKTKTDSVWAFDGQGLKCGDWRFFSEKPEASSFTFTWVYEEVKNADGSGGVFKTIILNCSRESKGSYKFLSAKREEEEYIVLAI